METLPLGNSNHRATPDDRDGDKETNWAGRMAAWLMRELKFCQCLGPKFVEFSFLKPKRDIEAVRGVKQEITKEGVDPQLYRRLRGAANQLTISRSLFVIVNLI